MRDTTAGFGASASGSSFRNDVADAPWDSMGRLTGDDLEYHLSHYERNLPVLVVTVETARECVEVDRLFVADHSVLPNSLGGPNPTNTGQATAARTADRFVDRHF